MPSNLLVANDVLCKFFAINGGAFGGKAGNVFYCVPDKRQMGRYAVWLLAVFIPGAMRDISKFYKLCRWNDWPEDVRNFSLDKVMFTLLPILWQDTNVSLRLKNMKKDDICMNEFFHFCLQGASSKFI